LKKAKELYLWYGKKSDPGINQTRKLIVKMHKNHQSHKSQPFDFNLYAIHQLQEIRIWTLVLGIFGMLAILFGLTTIIWNLSTAITEAGTHKAITKIPILIISALILAIPGYYLIRFSTLAGKALKTHDSIMLGKSLSYQKRYYRALALIFTAAITLFLLLDVWAMQPIFRG